MSMNTKLFLDIIHWKKIEKNGKFVVIVLVCIILGIALVVVTTKNRKRQTAQHQQLQKRVCLSQSCIEASSRILKNMDTNVDPCDDFYNFACGSFIKNTHLHADQYLANSFQDVQRTVSQQIRNILEDSDGEEKKRPFELLTKFYHLCTNTGAIEKDGLTTIRSIVQSLNGWPVVEGQSWYDGKFDWKQSLYTLRKIGFKPNYFLTVDVEVDSNDSSMHVITLDKPEFGINLEDLAKGFDDNTTQNYFNYMVDVAVLFGANKSMFEDELKSSLELEANLAKMWLSSSEGLDELSSYNPVTVDKLQHKYPNTDWKQFLKYLLDIPDFQIANDEIVVVKNPKYLDDLESLLNSTAARAQANYIVWRAIHSIVPYLNSALRNRRLVFRKEVYGEQSLVPKWKECMSETMKNFWELLTNAYLRKHSHSKSKELVSDMFSQMGSTFVQLIEESDWMDSSTKENAFDKAEGLPYFTIFSDEMNDDELIEFYSTLDFDDESYLKSVLSLWFFQSNNKFKKLREPVTKKDKEWDVSMVYQMGLPQGLFQGLFFDTDRPKYLNYGTIGSIIGHLLTHVFDEIGRQFDKNLDITDWWSNSTKEAYRNISQCVIDHYGSYKVLETGRRLQSKHTVHEDIADITGLKLSYLTYTNWSRNNDEEPKLPGLNFNQKQLFWISSANLWCTKYRIEYLTYVLLLKSFAPAYYRVTGVLRNLEEFSRDFNCSKESFMNPEAKCKIW